ncbi:uncharacterized protein LOC106666247 [Cimex lectularius]|uniref:Uncharacterized protein n=1 Tax=Cimex lectularius TaxID=79782 RepID=A0A8I6RNS5_CIMLE|nr:uncharacterized protein LOC106666247 [Cimex lectularius]
MKASKNDSQGSILQTKRCRDLMLISALGVLAIGCGTLYGLMEQNWALMSPTRERVLFVACLLVISSFILCYYIIKASQHKMLDEETATNTEIVCLLIDKPPSYESIAETPPPSYKVAIAEMYIVPCHIQRS